MTNFEVFRWYISSSINPLFLKSDVYIYASTFTNLPFMIHVEESTYKLIYSMFGSDFNPYSEKKRQEKQNTTGNCD